MRTLWLLSLALLLAGCGNPHLERSGVGAKVESIAPGVLAPLDLDPGTVDKQLSMDGDADSGLVNIKNPNTEDALIVSYRFEKGDHFRFRGGSYPGTGGDCAAELAAASSCRLDVEFFASGPGIYVDSLIATYASKNRPDDKHEVTLPLRGEKKARAATGLLKVAKLGGGDSLDFGRDVVGAPRSGKIVLTNAGEADLNIISSLEKGLPFRLINGCSGVIHPGQACELEVNYESSQVGVHQDNIVIGYSSDAAPEVTIVKFPVIGETVALSPTVRPGTLELAAISANNSVINIGINSADFGSVQVGSEVRKQIEVRNSGEAPVTLSDKVVEGPAFSFSGGQYPGANGTCGSLILPGSCLIEVVFRPNAAVASSGRLGLSGDGRSLSVNLLGRGLAAPAQNACEVAEEHLLVPRPSASTGSFVFPYLPSKAGTSARLSYLYGTATNHYIRDLNRYTVANAQVFVAYDIPRFEGKIVSASLGVDVLKVILEAEKDTESLCLTNSSIKRCSGHQFSLARWQALKNPAFWSARATPVNTTYEEQFLRSERRCGSYKCMSLKTDYDVVSLFQLSAGELQGLAGAPLAFVFSDDTRLVSWPRLVIKTRKTVPCN